MSDEKAIDHSDLTDEEKEQRVAETKMTGKELKAKMGKTKKAAKAAKPKEKKVAKKKTNGVERAPRVVLSETELGKPRETIRILPAVLKMVESFQKKRKLDSVNEAAEKMITTAYGRIAALDRYNGVA